MDGHELALIARMLAHTIYNPRRTLSMSFERIGEYRLSNLRTIVQEAFGSMLRSRPYVPTHIGRRPGDDMVTGARASGSRVVRGPRGQQTLDVLLSARRVRCATM